MMEVHFINVGYGDAILVLDKKRGAVLIDCGGETAGSDDPTGMRTTAAEYLKTLGVCSIDTVLVSHLHLDHSGGLLEIAQNFAVGSLWTNYVPAGQSRVYADEQLSSGPKNLLTSLNVYSKALQVLRGKGTRLSVLSTGGEMSCPFGDVRVLAAEPKLFARQAEILDDAFERSACEEPLRELDGFINNTSLRLQMSIEGVPFLFAGDIYAREWEKEEISQADVVKMSHHCLLYTSDAADEED